MTRELPQRFESKRDTWLAVMGFLGAGGAIIGISPILFQPIGLLVKAVVLGISILTVALILSVFLGTYYVVEAEELVVRSGPFRWRIPKEEIWSLTPTRSPWSSPALSLDRLRIDYGHGKWVLVSPERREEFASALGVPLEIS